VHRHLLCIMLTLAAPFTLTRSSRITSVERALGALEHSLEVGTNSEDSAPAPVKGVLLKKKPTLSSNPLGWDTRAFRAADYKLAWWGAEISAFPGGKRPKDFLFDAPGYKDGTWNEAFITACKATAGSYPTTVDGIRFAAAPDTYACFQLFTTTFGGGTEKDLLAFANAVDDWLQDPTVEGRDKIMETYVDEEGPRMVNLGEPTLIALKETMKEYPDNADESTDVFRAAGDEIKALMQRNVIKNFNKEEAWSLVLKSYEAFTEWNEWYAKALNSIELTGYTVSREGTTISLTPKSSSGNKAYTLKAVCAEEEPPPKCNAEERAQKWESNLKAHAKQD